VIAAGWLWIADWRWPIGSGATDHHVLATAPRQSSIRHLTSSQRRAGLAIYFLLCRNQLEKVVAHNGKGDGLAEMPTMLANCLREDLPILLAVVVKRIPVAGAICSAP
jgi:hypothetical protein